MDQAPGTKVGAAVVAGALMTIIWWVAGETAGVDPPPAVREAAVILVMVAGIWLAPERVAPKSTKLQLIREGWQPAEQDLHLVPTVLGPEHVETDDPPPVRKPGGRPGWPPRWPDLRR